MSSLQSSGSVKKRGHKRAAASRPYAPYIHRVLRQIHPDRAISNRSMCILESFVADAERRITDETRALRKTRSRGGRGTGKDTLTARDVQAACRLVLKGELAKHAIAEGTKAVTKFLASEANKHA